MTSECGGGFSMRTEAMIVCPTCGNRFRLNQLSKALPFCSHRCQLADLNRWLSEEIGLPTGAASDEDGELIQAQNESTQPIAREWRFND